MKHLTVALIVFFIISVCGCAPTNTITYYRDDGSVAKQVSGSDYMTYATAIAESEQLINNRISQVMDVPCPEDPLAAGYCNMAKGKMIEDIAMRKVEIVPPRSWIEVALRGWDSFDRAVWPLMAGYSIYRMSKMETGANISGETVNVSRSFNPQEIHSTGSSSSPITAPWQPDWVQQTTTTTTTNPLPSAP